MFVINQDVPIAQLEHCVGHKNVVYLYKLTTEEFIVNWKIYEDFNELSYTKLYMYVFGGGTLENSERHTSHLPPSWDPPSRLLHQPGLMQASTTSMNN